MVVNVHLSEAEVIDALVKASPATSRQEVIDVMGQAGIVMAKHGMEHAVADALAISASRLDLADAAEAVLADAHIEWNK